VTVLVLAQKIPALLVATLIGPPAAWASPSLPDTIYDAQNLELPD
jgi:hypothetical protein